MSASVTVICLYRVSAGREAEFAALMDRHWPALRSLDLVTADPPQRYRGNEQDGGSLFVEIFRWKDDAAAGLAHEHPEVMAIWEPMGALTETRGGRPSMEFPHVQPLAA